MTRRVRPIRDGVLVRMDPPRALTAGGLHIPEDARADAGSWRAQREPKIGTVLAVGPGRGRMVRTGWERDPRKLGPLKPEEVALKYDLASEGACMPMGVQVGDRVLFDPMAELRPVDGDDPLLRMGACFQVCGVLVDDDDC